MKVDDPPDPISLVFSISLLPHSGHTACPNVAPNLLFIQFFKDISTSVLNHSFSHLLQRKQVLAPPNLRPSQARQSTAGRTPPMRTNLGSALTKTSLRAPLHQRHVAHFFCAIGMSSCAISFPFAFHRPARQNAASPAVVLRRRLVFPDGKRTQGTPQSRNPLRSRHPVRMITSLSEERRRVVV